MTFNMEPQAKPCSQRLNHPLRNGDYKHFYYRGYLSSCNYKCRYCPFSKNVVSEDEINKDKQALSKFLGFLETLNQAVTIFIVPYGEGLIHNYYMEAIARLSSIDNISRVSIQTNNSFNLDTLLKYIHEYNGNIDKIRLWCTYHPTQIPREAFISKCKALYKLGIEFSVGAVADPNEIESLISMRKNLPSDVYMWLNKLSGTNRKYTTDEMNEFLNIDPHFSLQLEKIKADTTKCIGGTKSVFVDYAGNMFPCNINNYKIGNIYSGVAKEIKCRQAYCSCYLAYSNRIDLPLLHIFKEERQLRIIPKNPKHAYFFDIDGTILDENGKMPNNIAEKIRELSKKGYIFLNTALPFKLAYKKCKKIWQHVHGGAFSNGSDIRLLEYDYKRIIPMETPILTLLDNRKAQYFSNYSDGILHKILVNSKIPNIDLSQNNKYNIFWDKSKLIITDIHASKLKGALFICRFYNINHNNVFAFGNSENDKEVLDYFSHLKHREIK